MKLLKNCVRLSTSMSQDQPSKIIAVGRHGQYVALLRDDPQQNTTAAKNGSCVAQLVSADRNYDPLMGMPVMSSFPVKLVRCADSH